MRARICESAFLAARRENIAFLLRYALVGTTTALIYVGLYVGLVDLARIPSLAASCFAFGVAVIAQYAAHSRFTFGRRAADLRQGARFLCTILLGLAASSAISVIGPAAAWSPLATAGIVVATIPALNLVLFALWVFPSGGRKTPLQQ